MPKSGENTKIRILDVAHALIMGHGLAGTSIDMVLEKAEITKGAFFYHFKSKSDLARALVERYANQDAAHLEENLKRAEKLSRDPLQQVLILIGLFQEEVEQLTEPGGGCLIASYTYQFEELDADIREISAQAVLLWRQRLGAKFEEVIAKYPPRLVVRAQDLADGVISTFEGAFVMMRVLREPTQLSMQLAHYRNYIELLFSSAQ
ncbi:MAG: TetR/AcrR family transcriptional regulator [Chlorogloeopsis fritschii C42_A2020_084]|uniref:TetR/AcrR family transcriptional regulator n=1 Tax=Chlorogloeopsis fritschii TaxID=1124 RepID=UPI001A0C3738|nr:TetR/AcrR family transcriptional regulator [Chlorogloeopsis fritschii]MBF2009365.1 TetR/AcrR family transcriptional regulator [Chlorogloeopsis fritschii C42_A2020_084]